MENNTEPIRTEQEFQGYSETGFVRIVGHSEQLMRERCYELALKSIHRDYNTLAVAATGTIEEGKVNVFEPNYTKKAQEIYDYITEGKVAQ